MSQPEVGPSQEEVDRFIQQEIDTVPQLEALVLLWNSRPRAWTLDDLAAALYIEPGATQDLLATLERRGLVNSNPETYSYRSTERDSLIQAVEITYRRELVRISRMIHSKAPAGIRAFANAFRFKKERD